MNKTHFMYVPFTGIGIHNGFRGDNWLKDRIKVFKNYTLRSLTNQTKKEFIIWISWREEERDNPIVKDFIKGLEMIRDVRIINTFHGAMFWDDKYNDECAKYRLYNSLKKTLPELSDYIPDDVDLVYMTIQPSDDMYICTAVEKIQKYEKIGAIGWNRGYIMDYRTHEIAEYNPDTNPPFYTIIFDRDTFLDPLKHFNFTGPYKSHEYVKFTEKHMPDRMFVVGTHGRNISTVYDHPYKGKVIEGRERDMVLFGTNTYFNEPLKINDSNILILRKIFNKLPFNNLIRNAYQKAPVCLKKF